MSRKVAEESHVDARFHGLPLCLAISFRNVIPSLSMTRKFSHPRNGAFSSFPSALAAVAGLPSEFLTNTGQSGPLHEGDYYRFFLNRASLIMYCTMLSDMTV
jgi:hypothetical protein